MQKREAERFGEKDPIPPLVAGQTKREEIWATSRSQKRREDELPPRTFRRMQPCQHLSSARGGQGHTLDFPPSEITPLLSFKPLGL